MTEKCEAHELCEKNISQQFQDIKETIDKLDREFKEKIEKLDVDYRDGWKDYKTYINDRVTRVEERMLDTEKDLGDLNMSFVRIEETLKSNNDNILKLSDVISGIAKEVKSISIEILSIKKDKDNGEINNVWWKNRTIQYLIFAFGIIIIFALLGANLLDALKTVSTIVPK